MAELRIYYPIDERYFENFSMKIPMLNIKTCLRNSSEAILKQIVGLQKESLYAIAPDIGRPEYSLALRQLQSRMKEHDNVILRRNLLFERYVDKLPKEWGIMSGIKDLRLWVINKGVDTLDKSKLAVFGIAVSIKIKLRFDVYCPNYFDYSDCDCDCDCCNDDLESSDEGYEKFMEDFGELELVHQVDFDRQKFLDNLQSLVSSFYQKISNQICEHIE